MIFAYTPTSHCLARSAPGPADPLPPETVWFDLVDPTRAEDTRVEALLGVEVPTREDMLEIEPSSRLYAENGTLYMTATLIAQADSATPKTTPVTFILAEGRLVTVRYETPRAFSLYETKATKPASGVTTGGSVLLGLLDAVVDRLADVLERLATEIDAVSSGVFEIGTEAASGGRRRSTDFAAALKQIGRHGLLLGKVEESVVSLTRMLVFLSNDVDGLKLGKDDRARLKILVRDIRSISEYATFLENKTTFLLDASLGLVSLQQATIVKIFSVLAVVFMPPTLIASIYGMNFEAMPELKWAHGYPFALGLMVVSVATTFAVFKWKRWL